MMNEPAAATALRRVPIRTAWFVVPLVALLAAVPFADGELDRRAFFALQGLTGHAPDVFWAIVTACGNGQVVAALFASALARPRLALALLWLVPIGGLFTQGTKRLVTAGRPIAEWGLDRVHVIGEPLRSGSFPSGHTATAFGVAAVVALLARGGWKSPRSVLAIALALVGASLVGLSRIAVGAHRPRDVLVGAALGWIAGVLSVAAVDRWSRPWAARVARRVLGVVVAASSVALLVKPIGGVEAETFVRTAAVYGLVVATAFAVAPRGASEFVRAIARRMPGARRCAASDGGWRTAVGA